MESSHAAKEGGPWHGWLRHRIRSKNRRRWLIGLAIVVTATAIFIFNSTRPPIREERIAAALQDLRRQVTRMDNARTAVWNALPSMLQNYTVGLLPTDPMQLRKYACHELVELNADSREVIDALAAALDDPMNMFPVLAVLQHLGPRASGALERLIGISMAPQMMEQEQYYHTLAAIAPTEERVVSVLISALSPTNDMCWSAARILKEKAPLYDEAVQDRILRECTNAPPQFTIPIVLSILPESEKTRSLALEYLRVHHPAKLPAAVRTIAERGTNDPEIIRALMQVLEWGPFHRGPVGPALPFADNAFLPWQMPNLAIVALGKSGTAAEAAVPLLRRMLEDNRYGGRHGDCAIALWRITGDFEPVMTVFEPMLKSGLASEAFAAHSQLYSIAAECPVAMELVARGLTHKDKNIRLRTVNMLGTLGEKAKAHLHAIEALQRDEIISVRRSAEKAAAKIRGGEGYQ